MSAIGQKLIAEIVEVAADNPDHEYKMPGAGCRYVADGQPSCIVGWAAWNLDLIDGSIEDSAANEGGIDDLEQWLGAHFSTEEEQWLIAAQAMQDDGTRWGEIPYLATVATQEYETDYAAVPF